MFPKNDPPYLGRLAPSPTGYLHLGHARTFWVAWERALSAGGAAAMRLRIEDLDPQRSKEKFVEACLEDFQWMGLGWTGEVVRQSERKDAYREVWQKLKSRGQIFPCSRSRRDVREAAGAPHEDTGESIFPVEWRPSSQAVEAFEAPGEGDVNWRFRVPVGRRIRFVDQLAGEQCFVAGKDFGDFVIWRRDDVPAYELAVVVDDAEMGITEVVRGRDLLISTARQILIYEALGLPPPDFAHVELVRDAEGRRLSKREGAMGVRELRARGLSFAEALQSVGVSFPG